MAYRLKALPLYATINNIFKVTICDLKNKDINMANNIDNNKPVAICDQSKMDVTKCDINKVVNNTIVR